jgi:hypothetical protein
MLRLDLDWLCLWRLHHRCLFAPEQALHDRRPLHRGGLVHHSDKGSQLDNDWLGRFTLLSVPGSSDQTPSS